MPKRVQNCNDIDTPFIHVTLTQDLPQLPLPPQSSSCLHTLHTTSTRPTPHPHVVHTTPNHNIFTKKHERLSIVFHKIAAIQRPSIARHTRRTTAYSQTTLSNNRVGSARNPRPQVCALLPDRSSDGRTCTLQPRTTLISSANPPSTLQLYPPPLGPSQSADCTINAPAAYTHPSFLPSDSRSRQHCLHKPKPSLNVSSPQLSIPPQPTTPSEPRSPSYLPPHILNPPTMQDTALVHFPLPLPASISLPDCHPPPTF